MKYFVQTSAGEIGPFTVAQLNRNFSAGDFHGAQLCRAENSTETRRLDEQFRHLGGNPAVVAAARASIAEYQQSDGRRSRSVGSLLAVIGFLGLCAGAPLAIFLPLLITGVGLISRGAAQEKRASSQLPPPPPLDKSAPPPTGPYDY